MDSIGNLCELDTAIDRAKALKAAYAEFVAAVQACVIEPLRVAGVAVEEARGTLIADAVHEGVVQKWPVLGNTDNKNPAARQGWF